MLAFLKGAHNMVSMPSVGDGCTVPSLISSPDGNSDCLGSLIPSTTIGSSSDEAEIQRRPANLNAVISSFVSSSPS